MRNYLGHQGRQLFLMVGRDSLSRRLFGRTRLCGPTFLSSVGGSALGGKFICVYFTLVSFVLFFTAGCGSPRVFYHPDAEMERNAAAAKSAYSTGFMESASVFYLKALNRARLADQPREISRLAYNLAACRAQTQQYSEALELLDEAEFESHKAGIDFPETVLLRAEILRHLGQTNEALAIARSGIDALDNLPRAARDQKSGPVRLQLKVFLAESACDQNDGKLALKELDDLDLNLLKSSDPVIQAKAAHARGRALLIEKRFGEAATYFVNAAGSYQKARHYPNMAVALQNAGRAYEAADQCPLAVSCYYRAARSLFICGNNTKAQESFNKANELAKKNDDQQMLNALARLKSEISHNAESEDFRSNLLRRNGYEGQEPQGILAEPSEAIRAKGGNSLPEKAQAE